MNIESKLKQLLLPVLGIDSVDNIKSDAALVKDLGADSLDFVEIFYVIEKNFGVVVKSNEISMGGISYTVDKLFKDGSLTVEGAEIIKKGNPQKAEKFRPGMTIMELYLSFTVRDLADIIKSKMPKENSHAQK